MDYFAIFFSFMLPSVFLGVMIAAAIAEQRSIRRRTKRIGAKAAAPAKAARPVSAPRSKLYIYNMEGNGDNARTNAA